MQSSLFGNLPLKRKIFLQLASVAGGALLFFSVLSVLNLSYTFREVMVERIGIVTELLEGQSIATLRLPRASQSDMGIQAILKNDPGIEAAVVYCADNSACFTYLNPGNTANTVLPESIAKVRERFFFKNGKIKFETFHPVKLKGKYLGTLYILSNTNKLISHLRTSLLLIVFSFIVSLGGALVAASRMQKIICQPVFLLADSARKVAEEGDYSIRVEPSTTDEVGDLITNFNLILEVTQLRGEQLNEHHMNLEFIMGQRTEELLRRQDDTMAEPTNTNDLSAKTIHERQTPQNRISSNRAPDVQLTSKVLLVDDEPINRKVVVASLQKFGLEMEVAQNGIEAIRMIEANYYSVVFMDIHMPELNGFEATKMIRTLEKKSERGRATIIAMTADVAETTRQKCLEVGMDDLLTKPIKPEILIERIAHWRCSGKHKTSPSATVGEQERTRTAPEQELWNRSRTLEFVGGDEALFCEIATVFIGRNDLLLQNIAVAIAHGDADDLLETAHAYKGAIGYFASQVLRQSAMALENMAQKGQIDGANVHLVQLQEKSRMLCSDLSQMVFEAQSG